MAKTRKLEAILMVPAARGPRPASDLRLPSELIESLRPETSLSYFPAPSCQCPGPLARPVANIHEARDAGRPRPAPCF